MRNMYVWHHFEKRSSSPATRTVLLLAVAAISAARVSSFIVSNTAAAVLKTTRSFGLQQSAATTLAPLVDLPDKLPPQDESFGPIASVRELLSAPEYPEGSQRYDGIGQETGGIWRSKVLGLVPSTVVAAPLSTKWMTKQEIDGNIAPGWPTSFGLIFGENAIINLGSQPEVHAKARKVLKDTLSPEAVLELQPVLEASLEKRVRRWEQFAASGQEFSMMDEIYSVTLDIMCTCFLGDYATEEVVEDIGRVLPVLANGIFSVPRSLPWPLNLFPAFAFGASMSARKELDSILEGVLQERRADPKSAESMADEGGRRAGVLDAFLALQKKQKEEDGGPGEGETVFDDRFIFDNVIFAIFAGYDTTAVSLTRMLQLLGSADGKTVADQLLQELSETTVVAVGDKHLADGASNRAANNPAKGIFAAFPLLNAVALETSRVHPSVPGAFRKALNDIEFNGYLIPAGTTVSWNVLSGYRAESLYPEPKRFCPFRFLHGDTSADSGDPTTTGQEQPRPSMWGYGRHMCPGRELAKLEIVLVLRTLLSNFDYELAKGQSFHNTLPVNAPRDRLRVVLKAKTAARP